MNEPGSPTSGLSSMYSLPKALERRRASARMLESVKEPVVDVLAGEAVLAFEEVELKEWTSASGVPSLLGWAEAELVEVGPLEGLREGGM